MSDRNDALSVAMRAVLAYREELDTVQPSSTLDDRIEVAVRTWSMDRGRTRPRRLFYWAAAATAAAAIVAGLYLRRPPDGEKLATAQAAGEAIQMPAGGVSPMGAVAGNGDRGVPHRSGAIGARPEALIAGSSSPAAVAVFRVRASLGAGAAAAAKYGPAESRYWVDLGVGNDGALRIVRVLPADGPERVVP